MENKGYMEHFLRSLLSNGQVESKSSFGSFNQSTSALQLCSKDAFVPDFSPIQAKGAQHRCIPGVPELFWIPYPGVLDPGVHIIFGRICIFILLDKQAFTE